MKRPRTILTIITLILLCTKLFGQDLGAQAYSDKYSKEIIHYLTDEKFQGRESGTKELKGVIKYISKEFKKSGWEVTLQKVTAEGLTASIGEPKPGRKYPGKITNVIAKLDGKESDKYVVIGAHFDHLGNKEGLGIHPGADDNASGIAVLLNLAKMIKASGLTPDCNILLCAWDGEEKGLLGSKHFVSTWEGGEIIYYMNFDMVGRTKTPENPGITFAWNDNYPRLRKHCEAALKNVPTPFEVFYDQRWGDGKGGSDYAPFSKRNIPFVAWMEVEMHEDYHKPGDTPDKICWDKLQKGALLSYWVIHQLIFPKK